jgi:hypothetical protein
MRVLRKKSRGMIAAGSLSTTGLGCAHFETCQSMTRHLQFHVARNDDSCATSWADLIGSRQFQAKNRFPPKNATVIIVSSCAFSRGVLSNHLQPRRPRLIGSGPWFWHIPGHFSGGDGFRALRQMISFLPGAYSGGGFETSKQVPQHMMIPTGRTRVVEPFHSGSTNLGRKATPAAARPPAENSPAHPTKPTALSSRSVAWFDESRWLPFDVCPTSRAKVCSLG